MAQFRNEFDAAEDWYRKALKIKEMLGNRPSMAITYAQLGVLAEARGRVPTAFQWFIQCILLFDKFDHRSAGPALQNLAILTKTYGAQTLATAWSDVTGEGLPDGLIAVLRQIKEGDKK